MKKILILSIALFCASLSANAAYLYWQVDDYSEPGATWNAVSMYVYDKVNQTVLYTEPGKLTIYYEDDGVPSSTVVGASAGDKFYTDVTDYTDTSKYSYYVEYYNYNGTEASVLPSSKTKVAGGIISDATPYDSVGSLTDLPGSSWATPATYTAVPEPTSGLMLLFGAAMLGLKRKNRSRA